MDTSGDESRCGLCGQVMDARHGRHHEEPAGGAGRRVEYVVIEVRGACAHFQAADAPARIRKTGAADLAEALGIGLADLPGRHYTCWETPVEYGVIRNGFELA